MDFTLYNKTCTTGMKDIKNNSINLILTSPPYWDLKDYKVDAQLGLGMTYEYYLDELKKSFRECVRVLKNDSFCVINIADIRRNISNSKDSRPQLIPLHCDVIHYFESMGLEFFSHHIWKHRINNPNNKIYGANSKGYFYPPYLYGELSIEHILVFRKGGPLRKLPILSNRLDKYKKSDISDWLQPVWEINSTSTALHLATFPEELVKRIICLFSVTNDTVLDPFCGTGTTLKVSKSLNRSCIGYELNINFITPLITEWNMQQQQPEIYTCSFA